FERTRQDGRVRLQVLARRLHGAVRHDADDRRHALAFVQGRPGTLDALRQAEGTARCDDGVDVDSVAGHLVPAPLDLLLRLLGAVLDRLAGAFDRALDLLL